MSRLPWPEANRIDDAIYPDEYIEYFADRYVAGGWVYRGVTLMQFLARPFRYINNNDAPPQPLLGAQVRVRNRLIKLERTARKRQTLRDGEPLDLAWLTRQAERGLEHLPRRNGAPFEVMHHHAHPRTTASDFNLKIGARR
ncbi:MAG TPA: hypothetical protein VFS24_06245 [Steroidobacteraceae bacterium]|nr:hypothetical protein [Steroidobacteraceae bacterium]